MNEKIRKYDVVISGGGPAALATAYHALKAHKTVLIISECQSGFTRVQHVHLNWPLRHYLRSMFPMHLDIDFPKDEQDKKFLSQLESHLSIAIKDVERFIMRRLDELNNNLNRLTIMYEKKLQSIDMKHGVVHIIDVKKTYNSPVIKASFNYLVGAEGIKHRALNILKEAKVIPLEGRPTIEVTKNLHKHHVSAYLTVQRTDGKKLHLPDKYVLSSSYYDHLYVLSLDSEKYNLQQEKWSELKPLKLMFVGELPKVIDYTEVDNSEEIFEYIKDIINEVFIVNDLNNGELEIELVKHSQKHGERKDQSKCIVFESSPIQYQLPIHKVNTNYFLQVGDALINSDYRTGGGLMLALHLTRWIGELLLDKINMTQYKTLCDDNFNALNTNAIQLFSKKNYQNKVAKALEHSIDKMQQEIGLMEYKRQDECVIL